MLRKSDTVQCYNDITSSYLVSVFACGAVGPPSSPSLAVPACSHLEDNNSCVLGFPLLDESEIHLVPYLKSIYTRHESQSIDRARSNHRVASACLHVCLIIKWIIGPLSSSLHLTKIHNPLAINYKLTIDLNTATRASSLFVP